MICVTRQIPNSDPKFHQVEMFGGVGRSIRASLMVLRSGWFLRRLRAIGWFCMWILGQLGWRGRRILGRL